MTRWIELRRHSLTKKGAGRGRGSHLSQEGVELARSEGERLRHVRYVAVSESPRTLETAIAMGAGRRRRGGDCGSNVTGEVASHEWYRRKRWRACRFPLSRYCVVGFSATTGSLSRAARPGDTLLPVVRWREQRAMATRGDP
jgi:hypothetical protein